MWMRISGAYEKKIKSDLSYKDVVKASSNDHLMTSKQIEKVKLIEKDTGIHSCVHGLGMCMHIKKQTHTHTHTHMHTHTDIYIYIYIHMIHACTRTYTHTHTHVHTPMENESKRK